MLQWRSMRVSAGRWLWPMPVGCRTVGPPQETKMQPRARDNRSRLSRAAREFLKLDGIAPAALPAPCLVPLALSFMESKTSAHNLPQQTS